MQEYKHLVHHGFVEKTNFEEKREEVFPDLQSSDCIKVLNLDVYVIKYPILNCRRLAEVFQRGFIFFFFRKENFFPNWGLFF